jgi:hypothetical protein
MYPVGAQNFEPLQIPEKIKISAKRSLLDAILWPLKVYFNQPRSSRIEPKRHENLD